MRSSHSRFIVAVRLCLDIFLKIEKWLLNCTFHTWFHPPKLGYALDSNHFYWAQLSFQKRERRNWNWFSSKRAKNEKELLLKYAMNAEWARCHNAVDGCVFPICACLIEAYRARLASKWRASPCGEWMQNNWRVTEVCIVIWRKSFFIRVDCEASK